jgi:hypothetical protein
MAADPWLEIPELWPRSKAGTQNFTPNWWAIPQEASRPEQRGRQHTASGPIHPHGPVPCLAATWHPHLPTENQLHRWSSHSTWVYQISPVRWLLWWTSHTTGQPMAHTYASQTQPYKHHMEASAIGEPAMQPVKLTVPATEPKNSQAVSHKHPKPRPMT